MKAVPSDGKIRLPLMEDNKARYPNALGRTQSLP
jgi:hypothetical protein